MVELLALSLMVALDVVATFVCSFLAFDFGVYLKTFRIKRGKFDEFMRSKREWLTVSPLRDLIYLLMAFVVSIAYIVVHFTLFGLNPFLAYLGLIPLSLVFGYHINPDNIKTVYHFCITIKGISIPLGNYLVFQGSMISFSKSNALTTFYSLLKAIVKIVLYFVFALCILVIILAVYSFLQMI